MSKQLGCVLMEEIYAYHMTSQANVHSILLNGLVPSIGSNSKQVQEQNLLTYFTTLDCVDTWINRFNLDRDDIVLLKFPCSNYIKRMDSANDYFTKDVISSEKILVVGDEELSLEDFYQQNKEVLDLAEKKRTTTTIKRVVDRLDLINKNEITLEDGWDYFEVDPDIVETMEALKSVKALDNKSEYQDILASIKDQTLQKLVNNDLGITTNSAFYQTIDTLFNDTMADKSNINLETMNCLTVLLRVNLFYRQLDRYNRIGKKYEDNPKWRFDTIENMDRIMITNHESFGHLLDETKKLYEDSIKNIHK